MAKDQTLSMSEATGESDRVLALERQVAELKASLAEVREAKSHPVLVAQPPREAPQAKLERRMREAQEARDRVDNELIAGPKKFNVSLEKEPRMTRLVGARDEHEARAKYLSYFGIRGLHKEMKVEEVAPEAKQAAAK